MTVDPWVWVTDVYSGHARPMTRDAIALDPDRYRVDEAHPVRDEEGRLLPVRFRLDFSTPVEQTDPTLAPVAPEAEEAT